MKRIEVTIDGMHCEACVAKLRDAFQARPDVSPEQIEIGRILVSFDPESASTRDVIGVIKECGFEVAAFRGA